MSVLKSIKKALYSSSKKRFLAGFFIVGLGLLLGFQNIGEASSAGRLKEIHNRFKVLSEDYWGKYQTRRKAEISVSEFIKPESIAIVDGREVTIGSLITSENEAERRMINEILSCRQMYLRHECPKPPRILTKGINVGPRYVSYWDKFYADVKSRKVSDIEKYFIRTIKTVGFHYIRVPIELDKYYNSETGLDLPYLNMLDDVIDMARKQRLKVALVPISFKWNFNKQDYFPVGATLEQKKEIVEKRFRFFWSRMAYHFKHYSNDLIFELTNEPTAYSDNSFSAKEINNINYSVYYNIRKYYPQRPMVLFPAVGPGRYWYQPDYVLKAMDYFLPGKVLNDPRLVLTFHYYQPHDFTDQYAYPRGDGKSWDEAKLGYADNKETRAAVKNYFLGMREKSREKGVDEVWVGEFGSYCAAPRADRIAYNKVVSETARELGLPAAVWSAHSGGPNGYMDFGIFNGSYRDLTKGIYGVWDKDMLIAVLPEAANLDMTNKYINLGTESVFKANLTCKQ